MLEALRKSTAGILAKILIGLLVLSFAVWGISDVITGVNRSAVASVGDTEIGAEEFRREYLQQLDTVSAQFGRRLTPAQARTFGIENRILSTMIGARAVDAHARELNLSITDGAVEQTVRADPLFRGPGGQFSPNRLTELLARGGYSEEQFIASRRADTIREQLTGAMLENVTVPEVLYDMYRTFQAEERKVRYFTIDPKVAVTLSAPTDEQLKTTYDQNKSSFMTTETRQIEVLMLTADDAKKKLKITDDELKSTYERDKDSYSEPEERRVFQVAFKDKAAAEKARAEITGGKSFEEVAKATGAKETDIDLGTVTKDKLIDPAIADAAFKLKKDEVSGVVEGRFSTVLLMVKDIKPGKVPTFEEVKQRIRDGIAGRQAPDEIRKLNDQVDDNRLAGKSLKEIGELLAITYHDIAAVERSGNKPDGKAAFESPDRARIVSTAFESSVGVENEVIELSDGGYAWVRTLKITKSEQKPFDTVKADVEKRWREVETRKELTTKAKTYIDSLKSGTSFEDVAKKAGGTIKTTEFFKRADSLPDLTRAAVSRAFALKKGVPASAATTDNASRVVFEVSEIKAPENLTGDDRKRVREELANQLRTDAVAEYVIALRDRLGVSINQPLIDQTVGIAPANGSGPRGSY